jgi:type II secretory pathway predicted ATPase ExeA
VFLAVQTPAGVRYTRDGYLLQAPDGTLRTARGDQVLTAPRSPRGLLQLLCHALGLDPAWFAVELQRQVRDAFCRLDAQGVTAVLLCDEAQLAPVAVLDELRLLTNTAMDARCPLAIVLSGHASLRRRLALGALAPLAQRVTAAAALPGLSAAQTAAYIDQQLAWAGAGRPLFTREVVELIAHYSRGVPRQINRLATASLLAAFAVQQPIVEEPAFRRALKPDRCPFVLRGAKYASAGGVAQRA